MKGRDVGYVVSLFAAFRPWFHPIVHPHDMFGREIEDAGGMLLSSRDGVCVRAPLGSANPAVLWGSR